MLFDERGIWEFELLQNILHIKWELFLIIGVVLDE